MDNYIKENYLNMLHQLGKTVYQFQQENILSPSTERRIRNGDPASISDRTVHILVDYYNRHGSELFPHHVDLTEFKTKDLSKSTQPIWENADIVGDYIALYLSRRGTGKLKSMALTIREAPDQTLEVRAIDIIQNPNKTADLISNILKIKDLSQAKAAYKEAFRTNYSVLRGSRFLYGVASGRGNLLFMHLKDDTGYEMTVYTQLRAYLKTRSKSITSYSWRGGAAILTVCDLESWPYSMVIGMMELKFWHPKQTNTADIINALQRMHTYQKKENMLCLQHDIDSLWYEAFMDVHRQIEESTDNSV